MNLEIFDGPLVLEGESAAVDRFEPIRAAFERRDLASHHAAVDALADTQEMMIQALTQIRLATSSPEIAAIANEALRRV